MNEDMKWRPEDGRRNTGERRERKQQRERRERHREKKIRKMRKWGKKKRLGPDISAKAMRGHFVLAIGQKCPRYKSNVPFT